MNDKKLYKVLNPIGLDGRRERGEIIALTEDVAATHMPHNLALHADEVPEEKGAEKPIAELSVKELRAKAAELELDNTGSKADLIERITLFLDEQ